MEEIIPLAPFTIVGAGGSHKTTIAIKLMVHVILGRDVWGQKIDRPAPAVIISKEDDMVQFKSRIHKVCRAMGSPQKEAKEVGSYFLVLDLTEQGQLSRLVQTDRNGNFEQTAMVDAIIQDFTPTKSPLVLFDPATYFGPGERHVNDGEAELLAALWRISRGIGGGAVGVIHHTGQEAARNGTLDQCAGRGGSALADNARGVITIRGVEEHSPDLPDEATPEHVLAGKVAQIRVAKSSYRAAIQEDLFVIRGLNDAFDLRFVRGKPKPAVLAG